MKGTDHFKKTILMYLEQRAEEDQLFAKSFSNPAKNIDEKDLRGNGGTNGCLRGEGCRLAAQGGCQKARQVAHGRRGLRAVENQPTHVAETA